MSLDAEGLRKVITNRMGDEKVIVVSNREPYIHSYVGEAIRYNAQVSGLITALEPVMYACGGTWVAHGSGDADREVVDEHDRVGVPPEEPRYHLKRVWLSKAEEEDYYYGFSNQGLWPLCHLAYTRPLFRWQHWQAYKEVNQKFAKAVLEEAGSDPAWVFIQDYHFALLPKMLKEARPDLRVAHFWHIPWPSPEVFEICPWREEVIEGLLGNDLMGFQIQFHCNNFLSTVQRGLECVVDYEHFAVARKGHRTLVRPYPVSVDYAAITAASQSPEVAAEGQKLRSELGLRGLIVGVGVDRIDYTKGIPERFLAIDRFLEKYPDYQKRFTFLQIGPISRIHIEEYKDLNDQLYHLMVEINHKYEQDHWVPIRILKADYPRQALLAFFQLADLCIVSSVHDGMNLVAKEFVAARPDNSGVLVLSEFTGAARELGDAVMVNPYDIDAFADAIKTALEMSPDEQERRMSRMRESVEENGVYDWAARMVTDLSRLS